MQIDEIVQEPALTDSDTIAIDTDTDSDAEAAAFVPHSWEVCFDNVSFSYQKSADPLRKQALSGISFTAPQGQMTALVGESGGGKSTIGQLLLRFWETEEGDYHRRHTYPRYSRFPPDAVYGGGFSRRLSFCGHRYGKHQNAFTRERRSGYGSGAAGVLS